MRHAPYIRGRSAERRERRGNALALIRGSREDFSRLDGAVGAYRGEIGICTADVNAN